jgi:hypothetical protein
MFFHSLSIRSIAALTRSIYYVTFVSFLSLKHVIPVNDICAAMLGQTVRDRLPTPATTSSCSSD